MDHIASWTSELSRRSVLGVRVFVAAVASVSLLATSTALAAARTPQGTTRIGMFAHPPGPAPFRGRDLPSIRAAEALLGVHIPRPHGSTATDRKAWSVVVDQRNRLVAITYRHDGLFWYSSHGRVQVIVEFRGRFFARTAGDRGWARRQVRARRGLRPAALGPGGVCTRPAQPLRTRDAVRPVVRHAVRSSGVGPNRDDRPGRHHRLTIRNPPVADSPVREHVVA